MEAAALPPRWGAYARHLPSSLDDLRGPAVGEVELPLHVAWSGRRVYDVGQEDQRLVLYALLLAEAQREDLERFVHRGSLVSMWPRLRRLLGPHARRAWERQLADWVGQLMSLQVASCQPRPPVPARTRTCGSAQVAGEIVA